MQLIVDKQKASSKQAHRLQKRFDQLRQKFLKERRRSERFRQDIDDLVEIYQRRSVENDRSMLGQLIDLSSKLVTFAGRKSLADWHRDELGMWLSELINHRISTIDPDAGDRLRHEYAETLTRMMGISFEELVAQAEQPEQPEQPEAHLFEEDDDSCWQTDSEQTQRQSDIFGFRDEDMEQSDDTDDVDFEAEFAEAFEAFGEDWGDGDEKSDHRQTLMDGRWAKAMFRRAAQALHPDREQDPQQRKIKQKQMQDLLKARKEDDVLAILTIYSEHVSGAGVVLAEHEMTEVCDELEYKLEEIEFEKNTYIHTHPLRQMVFDLFYHSTTKGRARRIETWEQSLQEEASYLEGLVPYLRNLTHLKEVLGERRDERESMLFAMMIEDEELRI